LTKPLGGLEKKRSNSGGKAWQREDKEDRTIPYKTWINSHDTNGFWLDCDAIKWRLVDNHYVPLAITELTACGWETTSKDKYLKSIEERIFQRDSQGNVIKSLGRILNIPVYWVVFPPSVNWLYVFSFRQKRWKLFTPDEWIEFLARL